MCLRFLFAVLGLCLAAVAAPAAAQYGQWSLERLHSNVVTLTYTQSIPRDDNDVGTAELAFICIQKDGSRTFGATLLPSERGYENAQDEVTVLITKENVKDRPIFRKNGKTVGTHGIALEDDFGV
jgi:hypothetical protein